MEICKDLRVCFSDLDLITPFAIHAIIEYFLDWGGAFPQDSFVDLKDLLFLFLTNSDVDERIETFTSNS